MWTLYQIVCVKRNCQCKQLSNHLRYLQDCSSWKRFLCRKCGDTNHSLKFIPTLQAGAAIVRIGTRSLYILSLDSWWWWYIVVLKKSKMQEYAGQGMNCRRQGLPFMTKACALRSWPGFHFQELDKMIHWGYENSLLFVSKVTCSLHVFMVTRCNKSERIPLLFLLSFSFLFFFFVYWQPIAKHVYISFCLFFSFSFLRSVIQ